MTENVKHERPLDFQGRPISLALIKELLRTDVAELDALYRLRAEDDARRREGLTVTPSRKISNLVELWERAHDVHWAWFKAAINDATTDRVGDARQGTLGSRRRGL